MKKKGFRRLATVIMPVSGLIGYIVGALIDQQGTGMTWGGFTGSAPDFESFGSILGAFIGLLVPWVTIGMVRWVRSGFQEDDN